jgi:thiol-disulfide isomerase/thioredoxin
MASDLAPPPLPLGRWDFDMSVQALDGEAVAFSGFAGKVLVLNFWATWCAPCVAEMPGLQRLGEATSDLEVTLACVTREPEEVVRTFLQKRPLDVPIYLLDGDPPESFRSRSIPATFILDKSGIIALRHFGAAAWDDPNVVNFIRGLAASPGG